MSSNIKYNFSHLYGRVSRLKSLASFLYSQRVKGFNVPDAPFFDSDESVDYFIEQLKKCDVLVEFGGGGSTVLADNLGKHFVTIEGDKYFSRAIRKKVSDNGLVVYRDIGFTIEWSAPVLRNLEKFSEYQKFPSSEIAKFSDSSSSILVLIDGRFRVSCLMNCLIGLKDHADWKLIFDDYTVRPEYHVIEEIIKPKHLVGRMAIFDSSSRGYIDYSKAKSLAIRYSGLIM